jgi:hypothetical protein
MSIGRCWWKALVLASLALIPARAEASSITYTEIFTFPDVTTFPANVPPGQNYYIGSDDAFCGGTPTTCQATQASILFDLTNTGNQSVYEGMIVDGSMNLLFGPLPILPESQVPTTDASGYVPGTGLASAVLTLSLRGLDPDNDNVLISAFAADGSGTLLQQTFLGMQGSTSVAIPLNAAMLAALASDGAFGIIATSFGTNVATFDFNLESARLDATTPVPEPGTLALLGIGLAAARRFRRKLS